MSIQKLHVKFLLASSARRHHAQALVLGGRNRAEHRPAGRSPIRAPGWTLSGACRLGSEQAWRGRVGFDTGAS